MSLTAPYIPTVGLPALSGAQRWCADLRLVASWLEDARLGGGDGDGHPVTRCWVWGFFWAWASWGTGGGVRDLPWHGLAGDWHRLEARVADGPRHCSLCPGPLLLGRDGEMEAGMKACGDIGLVGFQCWGLVPLGFDGVEVSLLVWGAAWASSAGSARSGGVRLSRGLGPCGFCPSGVQVSRVLVSGGPSGWKARGKPERRCGHSRLVPLGPCCETQPLASHRVPARLCMHGGPITPSCCSRVGRP